MISRVNLSSPFRSWTKGLFLFSLLLQAIAVRPKTIALLSEEELES